jgi:hypothetical protein
VSRQAHVAFALKYQLIDFLNILNFPLEKYLISGQLIPTIQGYLSGIVAFSFNGFVVVQKSFGAILVVSTQSTSAGIESSKKSGTLVVVGKVLPGFLSAINLYKSKIPWPLTIQQTDKKIKLQIVFIFNLKLKRSP